MTFKCNKRLVSDDLSVDLRDAYQKLNQKQSVASFDHIWCTCRSVENLLEMEISFYK